MTEPQHFIPTRLAPEPQRRALLNRRQIFGGAATLGLGVAGLAASGSLASAGGRGHGHGHGHGHGGGVGESVTVDGLKITKVKNLTGVEETGKYGIHWADLGEAARTPDGRTIYIFGDTFGPKWGENWRSPTALWSKTRDRDLKNGITFSGSPGNNTGKQLIDYVHGEEISTIIPSDVITLGRTMYLHGVVNQGFGNAIWSGIWTSKDNGETWVDSGARFDANAYDKMWQLATWDVGADGWLYVYTSKFLRQTPMILHKVRPHQITNPDAYIPWGKRNGRWQWGVTPTPVTDGIIGEASLRRFGRKWLLTWFDGPNYRIAAQVLDHPTQDLRKTKTITLLHGTDWDSQDVNHVAQLYGSYVIPGSTLDDVHLTVSQWNTGDNSVYHVMQYRFQGLHKIRR